MFIKRVKAVFRPGRRISNALSVVSILKRKLDLEHQHAIFLEETSYPLSVEKLVINNVKLEDGGSLNRSVSIRTVLPHFGSRKKNQFQAFRILQQQQPIGHRSRFQDGRCVL